MTPEQLMSIIIFMGVLWGLSSGFESEWNWWKKRQGGKKK
jgi:hypothetical protein